MRQHLQARHIHDWLADAARLGQNHPAPWATLQIRALVAAATAGVLRALAVKKVAWACGYAHPSYFIHRFRAQYGQTP